MAGISNAAIARMFDMLDKKIDDNFNGVNKRLDTINGRSFKNSTDIARMKGTSGAISACVSFGISVAYFLWNMLKAKAQ